MGSVNDYQYWNNIKYVIELFYYVKLILSLGLRLGLSLVHSNVECWYKNDHYYAVKEIVN